MYRHRPVTIVVVASGRAQGLLGFSVVANVDEWTAHGDGGLELQRGLRHFAAGAKVWVLPVQWGDRGWKVAVVGHHRGNHGRGYVRIVIPRHHLVGFRVAAIYSPALMRSMTRPWPGHETEPDARAPALWVSCEEAEHQAAYWRDHPSDRRA